MDIEEIQKRMSQIDPAINVHYFSSIDSTNTYGYYLGQQAYPDWQLIIADHQTMGQGRLNRKWESIAGKNLLFSILLRPEMPADQIQLLSLFFGAVVRQALENYFSAKGIKHLDFKNKWPNDIYLNGKKLSGILIKSAIVQGKFDFIVVGIGINVNQKKSEFNDEVKEKATSLFEETGLEWDRLDILVSVISHIYQQWNEKRSNIQNILPDWKEHALFLNERIQVHHFDKMISGIFVDINEKGHMILKSSAGEMEIVAGDLIPGEMDEHSGN